MSLSVNKQLPLFYRSLVPFSSTKHRSLTRPKVQASYGFAADTDVIPLLVSEVQQAVRHFPIVFIKDRQSSVVNLVALVGKGDGKNQFVDANGQWRPWVYIPAWVRRYPFALMADAKGDGQPTEQLQKIMEFQRGFLALSQLTERVTNALVQVGVLEDAGFSIRRDQSSKPLNVQGFMVVNETKLKALKMEQVDNLHRADALGLAYAQILSMSHLTQTVNGHSS
jgi:hypothetical protein